MVLVFDEADQPLFGEDVVPPYYAHAEVRPKDPCNPSGSEEFPEVADGDGLDNDGDMVYDLADPDCPVPSCTTVPGAIAGLKTVKAPTEDDARFSWQLDPDAASYRAYSVDSKTDFPPRGDNTLATYRHSRDSRGAAGRNGRTPGR